MSKVSWSDQVEERFAVVDNCSIRYLTAGEGLPLLLIHTIRTQSDLFQKVIPTLAKHFLVYAIDLPGHGGSAKPDIAYSEPYFRSIVTGFIKHMQLENLTIVGESIGAVLALTIAATSRGKILKEVFAINPYDYDEVGGIRRSSTTAKYVFNAMRVPLLNLLVSNAENDKILQNILYGGLVNTENLPVEFLTLLGATRKTDGFARAFRSVVRNNASWAAARSLYAGITVPVTLVYGSADWSTPAERTANKVLIPGNRYFHVPDTGHWVSLDNPVAFTDIVLRTHHKVLVQHNMSAPKRCSTTLLHANGAEQQVCTKMVKHNVGAC